MKQDELTFNDLPQVVAEVGFAFNRLRSAKSEQARLCSSWHDYSGRSVGVGAANSETNKTKDDTHLPMTAEQAAGYLQMPLGTLYMKLGSGEIPATKPGKRYVLFRDELDKWLEANRKNPIPLTAEETNAAILASHRRKPSRISLYKEYEEGGEL